MKDKKFPLIAKGIFEDPDKKLIVCFTKEKEGVVIFQENTPTCVIGDVYSKWVSCFNKQKWRIIAQPSEYPKEMYVSDSDSTDILNYQARKKVLGYFENLGYLDEYGDFWRSALNVEKPQEILLKIEELQEQLNELKSKL